jgi:hypothetical protein
MRSAIQSADVERNDGIIFGLQRDDLIALVLLSATGLGIWFGVSAITGQEEAFDSSLYYQIGIPLMALASLVAGFVRPGRSRLWGFGTVALQPVALFWGHDLWEGQFGIFGFPLILIFFTVLALGFSASAKLGNYLRSRFSGVTP